MELWRRGEWKEVWLESFFFFFWRGMVHAVGTCRWSTCDRWNLKQRRCFCSRGTLRRCPKLLKLCSCIRVEPNVTETCASETEDQFKDQSQVIIKKNIYTEREPYTTVSSLERAGTLACMMSMPLWVSISRGWKVLVQLLVVVQLGRCIYWWGFVAKGMPR